MRFFTAAAVIAFSGSPVFAQDPFPGYEGGPFFRFDNGAVGEIARTDGSGGADVKFFDGQQVQSANFPAVVDPTVSPTEDNIPLIRGMTIEDGQARQVIAGPNVCFDNNSVATSDPRKVTLCAITRLDFCDESPGIDPNGNSVNLINAPCIRADRGNSFDLATFLTPKTGFGASFCPYPVGSADGATPETACYSGDNSIRTTNFAMPAELRDLPSNITAVDRRALYDQALNRCVLAPFPDYSTDPDCAAFGPYPNDPDFVRPSDDLPQLSAPANLPPINQPVPAPGSSPGEAMNPGGFVPGGSGDGGGFTNSGGNGDGSGGGSSDGSTDGETAGQEYRYGGAFSPDDILAAGELDSRTIDLSSGLIPWGDGPSDDACPAPAEFEIFAVSIAIPYDPMCDLAIKLSGLIMSLAALAGLRLAWGAIG